MEPFFSPTADPPRGDRAIADRILAYLEAHPEDQGRPEVAPGLSDGVNDPSADRPGFLSRLGISAGRSADRRATACANAGRPASHASRSAETASAGSAPIASSSRACSSASENSPCSGSSSARHSAAAGAAWAVGQIVAGTAALQGTVGWLLVVLAGGVAGVLAYTAAVF